MSTVKEGDRVRIVAREATDEDFKSGMYYGHYAGMTGTVQKVYGKDEVAIEVEHDSLAKEIRKRHDEVRDQMKTKWLDGLSEEGRSKLTEREKDFNLRYMVLVRMADLEKAGKRPDAAGQAPPKLGAGGAPPATPESGPTTHDSRLTTPTDEEPAPHRLTLDEIEAKEQEELLRHAQRSQ